MLLSAAIPLGVISGVIVVAGMASDERPTREGWEIAVTSGVLALAALLVGSWLLRRPPT